MLETWVVLSLSALLLYGIAQVVNKSALQHISAPSYILISAFIATPIWIIFLIAYLSISGSWGASLEYTAYGILASIFGITGFYLFQEALQRGPVTIVGSITAAYPAIIVIVAIAFLGETLTSIQAIGVVIIVAGMVALSYSHENSTGRSSLTRVALLLSIATLILWGLWGIFAKIALEELEVILYLGLSGFITPPIVFLYLRHRKSQGEVIVPKWSIAVIIAIIASEVGHIGFISETNAISLGPAAIVFPFIAAYPVVMILLAYMFLKERLSKREIMLVLAVVVGIIFVSTV